MFHSPTNSPSQQYERTLQSPLLPGHAPTYTGLNYADITPADSASHGNRSSNSDNHSTLSSQLQQQNNNGNTFSFKFNYGNKTHRFRHDINNFKGLVEVIQQKIMVEHLNISQSYVAVSGQEEEEDWLTVAYLDDEDDQVLMTNDSDLNDAVQLARKSGMDRVRLFVHDSMADAVAAITEDSTNQIMKEVPASQPTTLGHILEDDEEEEAALVKAPISKKKSGPSKKRDISAEYNLPIPQDLLLPAAITFLGVAILGIFTISKLTSSTNSRY